MSQSTSTTLYSLLVLRGIRGIFHILLEWSVHVMPSLLYQKSVSSLCEWRKCMTLSITPIQNFLWLTSTDFLWKQRWGKWLISMEKCARVFLTNDTSHMCYSQLDFIIFTKKLFVKQHLMFMLPLRILQPLVTLSRFAPIPNDRFIVQFLLLSHKPYNIEFAQSVIFHHHFSCIIFFIIAVSYHNYDTH